MSDEKSRKSLPYLLVIVDGFSRLALPIALGMVVGILLGRRYGHVQLFALGLTICGLLISVVMLVRLYKKLAKN